MLSSVSNTHYITGYYVVLNTRNKNAGSEANLESEIFPAGDSELCLSFYYQMSGDNAGTLKVIQPLLFLKDNEKLPVIHFI